MVVVHVKPAPDRGASLRPHGTLFPGAQVSTYGLNSLSIMLAAFFSALSPSVRIYVFYTSIYCEL